MSGAEAVSLAGGAGVDAQLVTGRAEGFVALAVQGFRLAVAGSEPLVVLLLSPPGCCLEDIGVAQLRRTVAGEDLAVQVRQFGDCDLSGLKHLPKVRSVELHGLLPTSRQGCVAVGIIPLPAIDSHHCCWIVLTIVHVNDHLSLLS